MKLTTTLNKIRACSPRTSGWQTLLKHVGKDFDPDAEINLLTILESNGVADMLWTLRATDQDCYGHRPRGAKDLPRRRVRRRRIHQALGLLQHGPDYPGRLTMPTTVYPSRAGGFPTASFLTFADALEYVRTLNRYGLACGICTCPAASFAMHYPDTL